jgi:CPA2 family monovalent cation:H+ antiporter-2
MRERLADELRRVAFQRSFAHRRCAHLGDAGRVVPGGGGCPLCDQQGAPWVHLRMCLTCGAVGCCDSSKQRHARAHFEATGHPVIRSIEPGESWGWCYPDRAYLGSVEVRT